MCGGIVLEIIRSNYFLIKTKIMKPRTETFEMMVEGRPVEVKATPYVVKHNKQKKVRVSYNGSPVHIFGWDDITNQLWLVDVGADTIPPKIKQAIVRELEDRLAA